MSGLAVAGISTGICCCLGGGKVSSFLKIGVVAVLLCCCCKNRRKIPFLSSWADKMVYKLNNIERRNKERQNVECHSKSRNDKINRIKFDK